MFGDCVFLYLFIDASTEEYEEEGDYEEEEEHFDNCTNQGKLIPMQAILMQDVIATLFLFRDFLPIPSFYLAKLLLLFITAYFYS